MTASICTSYFVKVDGGEGEHWKCLACPRELVLKKVNGDAAFKTGTKISIFVFSFNCVAKDAYLLKNGPTFQIKEPNHSNRG